jgi:hypothetical protein
MSIDSARASQRQQQQASIERQSQAPIVQIGDRDPATGNYQINYADGGTSPNGIKVFSAAHEKGDLVLATPRNDGAVGLDSGKAGQAQADIFAISPDKCRGYLKGQIYDCPHPDEYRKIQVLYSVIVGDKRQFWVGGFARNAVFVCDLPASEPVNMAEITNLGKNRWIVAISYSVYYVLRRIETQTQELSANAFGNNYYNYYGSGLWSLERLPYFTASGGCIETGTELNGSKTCNYVYVGIFPQDDVTGTQKNFRQRTNVASSGGRTGSDTSNYLVNYRVSTKNISFPDNSNLLPARQEAEASGSEIGSSVEVNGPPSTYTADRSESSNSRYITSRTYDLGNKLPNVELETSFYSSRTSKIEYRQIGNPTATDEAITSNSSEKTARIFCGTGSSICGISTTDLRNDSKVVAGVAGITQADYIRERVLSAAIYWHQPGKDPILIQSIDDILNANNWLFPASGNLVGSTYYNANKESFSPQAGTVTIKVIDLPSLGKSDLPAIGYPIVAPNPTIHAISYAP